MDEDHRPNPTPTPDQTPVVVADDVESLQTASLQTTRRPRWWTPLVVIAASLIVFLLASFVMVFVGIWIVHGEITMEILGSETMLADVSRSRWGLLFVVVLPQLALVFPSVIAALVSPVAFRKRLGLVKGNWPVWAWVAAAVATPLVGLISSVVVGAFMEESDNLKEMAEIFRGHGENGFLIPLALMIGLTPAVCEEVLFRGYVQTRLTRSFHPAIGIFVASFLFAAFHMDLVHVVAVFPMGVFLGLVSWRSGSLVPAMMGHFVNNFTSVVAVAFAPEDAAADVLAAPEIAVSLAIIGSGIIGMAATIVASIMYENSAPEAGPLLGQDVVPLIATPVGPISVTPSETPPPFDTPTDV